jgi:hypothetical protein
MALAAYLGFVGLACLVAIVDWRRGWLLVLACGVLQDPVRKLTPGAPVYVSFAVVGLYAVILFSARRELIAHVREFTQRFANLSASVFVFILFLGVAAVNGLVTYGADKWKVPALSLFTYLAPLPAVILGYTYLQREEMMYRLFRVYAAITSVALIGTILEYMRVNSRIIGLVAFEGDYIRHLPGIQIRLLSGFYRSPDIMAWHAATLTAIAVAMALRAGVGKQLFLWSGLAGWGFLACMLGGRRKALYYVIAFGAVLLWRYFPRLKGGQVLGIAAVLLVLLGVVRQIASGERTSVYTRGATASTAEIYHRLEGGLVDTYIQYGFMGAGLGTATQGARHLLGTDINVGWQEGGLGKLAVEMGLPGIFAIVLVGWVLVRLLLRLTRVGDVPGSSQFIRALLFALLMANIGNFLASAQAYSDAILSLLTAFFAGCLFATATLDERLAAATAAREKQQQNAARLGRPLPA